VSKLSQLFADREQARALSEGPVEETLIAASISILAEGVAVLLFFCMLFVWFAVFATKPENPRPLKTISTARPVASVVISVPSGLAHGRLSAPYRNERA